MENRDPQFEYGNSIVVIRDTEAEVPGMFMVEVRQGKESIVLNVRQGEVLIETGQGAGWVGVEDVEKTQTKVVEEAQ